MSNILGSDSNDPRLNYQHNSIDRKNEFLKMLPNSQVPGIVRGLLYHASRLNLNYGGRRKSFESLQAIIGYHAAEIVKNDLVEPILREASNIIVIGFHGPSELAPLLHSAGATILTLGSKIHELHLFPLMIMIIEEHLASIEDRHRHCAMVLVGNCINFFGNNIGPSVDSFWAHLTSGVQDTSVKVRQAACFSLSYWVVHPELLKKVASRIKVLAPTILDLCRDPNTCVSACTVLIPLLENHLLQGHDHFVMILSSRLLETLPQSLKFLSVNVMSCIATSLKTHFLPYFYSSMRRLQDFSVRYEQPDIGLRLAVTNAITAFAKAVGTEAFHPYLADSIKNVLRGLSLDPPQLTEPSLFFIGSMAQLYGMELSGHLSDITNAIQTVALTVLTEYEEEALAITIRRIIQRTQGNIFALAKCYIDMLQVLLHRPSPNVRKTAIEALFLLARTLQEVKTSEEEMRSFLEIRAKDILLNADISDMSFSPLFDQKPVSSDRALNLDIILMDMDMGKGKYGHFPVSTALFSSKLSGLDLSRFLSVLLDRCGPRYCFRVQNLAFIKIADVLGAADEASWTSIEPLALQLVVSLYRGLRQGDMRPAAIFSMRRLIERTRLDLSMLYPSLIRLLCYALRTTDLSDLAMQVAASTISLLISRNPTAVPEGLAIDALVTSLSSPLELQDVILVFGTLRTIIDAHRSRWRLALCTSLVPGLLHSFALVIDAHASQAVAGMSEITQTLLCILFGTRIEEVQYKSVYIEISLRVLRIAVGDDISSKLKLVVFPLDEVASSDPIHNVDHSPIKSLNQNGPISIGNPNDSPITEPRSAASALKVPPEVIAQIMAFSLPRGRDWDVTGAENIPLILGQINGEWRQVALYTPRLWDSLDIELDPGRHEIRSRRIVFAVEIWLERSGGLPITLSIRCLSAGTSLAFHSNLERLMRTVAPFSRFWQDVQLYVPFSALQEFYTTHRNYEDMPRLRALSLFSSTFTLSVGQSPLLLKSAPLLQFLALHHIGLQPEVLQIPWNQLTSLNLRVVGWTARQCVDALSKCRRLKFLHLNAVWMPQERYRGEVRCLPSLEVLHINHSLSHLIPSLDLPRLHEMKTEHPGFSVALKWSNGGFINFLSALSTFRQRGVIPPTSIDQLRRDRQDRRFIFTILDPVLLDSTPLSRALPTLGTLAQYMGMVEIDCSLCTDQTILDIVAHVKQEVSSAPIYNVCILVHRGGSDSLITHLAPHCEGSGEISLTIGEFSIEIHFSRSIPLE